MLLINDSDIKELKESIKKNLTIYMTEDLLRFIFCKILINNGTVKKNEIIIEQSYSKIIANNKYLNNINKRKLDLSINKNKQNIAIEFKYHRNNNKLNNYDRTGRAGGIFNDINRLLCLEDNREKYFIYLTDSEMNDYFNNERNGLNAFYKLKKNNTLKLKELYKRHDFSSHFNKKAFESIKNNELISFKNQFFNKGCVKSLISYDDSKIINNHYLRIYKIL